MTNAVNIAQSGSNNVTFRNRIINGAMMIDQRNAGASVSVGNAVTVDRWVVRTDTGSGNTAQQSTTVPAGFRNSLVVTIGTGAAPTSGQRSYVQQTIEGFNVADLAWGTANAQPVTLSFWVRCSLTGTFGGALQNNAGDRSYPFAYTISSANTYEYKTITIPGDTTGTWLTNNGLGINMFINLGSGSTFAGTAGAWAASDFRTNTGATNVVATSGATFYITGVQLEEGTAASPFENRLYTTELSLCQRYFYMHAARAVGAPVGNGSFYTSGTAYAVVKLPVTMRTTPSLYQSNISNAWRSRCGNLVLFSSYAIQGSTPEAIIVLNDQGVTGTSLACNWFEADLSTAYLGFSAEL